MMFNRISSKPTYKLFQHFVGFMVMSILLTACGGGEDLTPRLLGR